MCLKLIIYIITLNLLNWIVLLIYVYFDTSHWRLRQEKCISILNIGKAEILNCEVKLLANGMQYVFHMWGNVEESEKN